jgi:hypothetical protein
MFLNSDDTSFRHYIEQLCVCPATNAAPPNGPCENLSREKKDAAAELLTLQ